MDRYEQFKKWASDMGDEFLDLFDAFEEEVLGVPPKARDKKESESVDELPKGETEFERLSRCKEQMEWVKTFIKSNLEFSDSMSDSCLAKQNGEGYDMEIPRNDSKWSDLNSLKEFLSIYYYLLQPFEFVPFILPESYGKDTLKITFMRKDNLYNRFREEIDALKKLY